MRIRTVYVDVARRLSWGVVVVPLGLLQLFSFAPLMFVDWVLGHGSDYDWAEWLVPLSDWWLP